MSSSNVCHGVSSRGSSYDEHNTGSLHQKQQRTHMYQREIYRYHLQVAVNILHPFIYYDHIWCIIIECIDYILFFFFI